MSKRIYKIRDQKNCAVCAPVWQSILTWTPPLCGSCGRPFLWAMAWA